MIPEFPVHMSYQVYRECTECHSHHIVYNEVEIYCKDCGLVLEDTIFASYNPLKGVFHNQMEATRSHWNRQELGSSIGRQVNKDGEF